MGQIDATPKDMRGELAFTCTSEQDHIPPRDPESDQLYKRARWLMKGNILKQDSSVYPRVERLLRIATAFGHDKASLELRNMLEMGQAQSVDRDKEIIDLVEALIRKGVPSAYYSMGWYLEHGVGVVADQESALKYFRKSADLGSPEAQYLVGDKLTDQSKNGLAVAEIGWSMYRCAAKQRHAKAAYELGNDLAITGRKPEALPYYQIAVAEGLPVAPHTLAEVFSEKHHADPVFGLNQNVDEERQKRYAAIADFLDDYEYLKPTVHELEEIVPLPPAKLPPWNGMFQWLEEHKANVPPPIPTEERIAEMARNKGLDPTTGRLLAVLK